jgi:hypothetical protein
MTSDDHHVLTDLFYQMLCIIKSLGTLECLHCSLCSLSSLSLSLSLSEGQGNLSLHE